MDIVLLREKIKAHRQLSGYSQKELAVAMGLHPVVLSHKLNGTHRYLLNHVEVKQIVLTLAEWDAFSNRAEALELLELAGLRAGVFSEAEWNSAPLNRLETVQVTSFANAPSGMLPKKESRAQLLAAAIAANPQIEQNQLPSDLYPPHNLPSQATPLVGRKKELTQVCNLLQRADVRFVTLTGPGGVGKTRLAIGAAFELLQDFGAGVHYVSLATLTNAGQLANVLVRSFGLQMNSGTNEDQLLQLLKIHLGDKHMLLVLDNFEQLLTTSQAVHLLARLLEIVPNLKMLVTSRMLLQLYGEHEFSVPTLELPKLAKQSIENLGEIARYEAVELFVARARAVDHAFRLNNTNSQAVVALCERLDGLPLAIELAAARIKLFPPAVILERISTSFNFLKSELHNRPTRHHTLRATLDWSYKLLDESEKMLFRALAIFRGGFSLEAVETICTNLPGTSPDFTVIEILEELVTKSLVKPYPLKDPDDANSKNIRFGMLETIREGALDYLSALGEENDFSKMLYRRYIEYYRTIAEADMPKLSGPEQISWLDELETEYANLMTTLELTLEADPDQPNVASLDYHFLLENGLRLAAALRPLWFYRGYWQETRKWIDLSLTRIKNYGEIDIQNEIFIKAVADAYYSAGLWGQQTGYANAKLYYEQALYFYQEIGNKRWSATTLSNLGYIYFRESDYSKARVTLEKSKRLFEECRYFAGQVDVVNYLAQISIWENNQAQARQLFEEGLSLARKADVKLSLGVMLLNFGSFLTDNGDYSQAEQYLAQALEVMQELGHKKNIANLLGVSGWLSYCKQNYLKARQQLTESIKICLELGIRSSIDGSIIELGEINIIENKWEQALLLLAAAQNLQKSLGIIMAPSAEVEYKRDLSQLQERLPHSTFQRLWDEGSTLPLEEVLKRCDIDLS